MKTYRAIPIEECNDPLVAIPPGVVAFTAPHPYVALGAPYGAASPWMLRRRVLAALLRARDELGARRPGWTLKLFDAYRPNSVQAFMVWREFGRQAKLAGRSLATFGDAAELRQRDPELVRNSGHPGVRVLGCAQRRSAHPAAPQHRRGGRPDPAGCRRTRGRHGLPDRRDNRTRLSGPLCAGVVAAAARLPRAPGAARRSDALRRVSAAMATSGGTSLWATRCGHGRRERRSQPTAAWRRLAPRRSSGSAHQRRA